jgi:acyl-homoserine-lactone acylase
VLAGWDGRSDIDSVGAHVFREFWLRTPDDRWEVPFDAAEPVTTPRDLDEGNGDVVDAMREALAFLEEEGIAFDAPLGSLQVAGDDGAPRIPIGGGTSDEGNANVVFTDDPASNTDAPYAISYGSSHIQAVAFTDEGVDASTILTYGVSTDATRRSSTDQTELFSQERWVDFPFTAQEIAADPQLRTYVVTGARLGAAPPAADPPAAAPAPTAVVRGSRALAATGGTPAVWALVALAAAVAVRRRAASGAAD